MFDLMSVEGYAVIYLWVGLCSLYIALLAISALGVVFILRKRRSSILKSQRPPRTPFSELEFNVATPTDAAKSRRVSFSRKTGVAEFATNEATTTWKSLYEEQNKSLESSGHDDRPRPAVLGHRLFDQQFQEVEAEIDFNYAPNPLGLNTSLNIVNVTQQIAMLDSNDTKLPAPQNKFELSAFTETNSKILNEITNPTFGADSGRIDINFSNLNTIGNDDLDEIEKDLQMSRPNIVGPNFGEVSQYIEFDLNSTQGPLRGNDSDMSITETIISPKKEVSKSLSIDRVVIDKENIVVNPYVSPAETDNFAINDETSQVLVFDGKKLKYADINADLDEVVQDVLTKPKRQTILEASEISMTKCIQNPQIRNMSVNHSVPNDIISETDVEISKQKRQTIVFANDDLDADISMTQAIPVNILSRNSIRPETKTKRETIVFDDNSLDADISVTQAVPAYILSRNSMKTEEIQNTEIAPKRQTIVFTNDDINADLSVTQVVPANILSRDSIKPEIVHRRQTILYDNNDIEADISMTQAIPANILSRNSIKPEKVPKRETIVSDIDANISTAQAFPSSKPEIVPNRQTMVFANDDLEGDISVTQAVPANILSRDSIKAEIAPKRQTKLFDNNDIEADISMTQAIPANILSRNSIKPTEVELAEIVQKRQTIVFANDDQDADISMTQAIPSDILSKNLIKPIETTQEHIITKRQTIVFTEDADISVTQGIPSSILSIKSTKPEEIETAEIAPKRQTIVFDNNDVEADISMTQSIPANILSRNSIKPTEQETAEIVPKGQTMLFATDDMDADISMTQAIPSNILNRNSIKPTEVESREIATKRQTILFSNNDLDADISMTQAVPSDILRHSLANIVDKNQTKSIIEINDESMKSESQDIQPKNEASLFDTESISATQSNIKISNKNNRSIYEDMDLDSYKENARQPTLVYTLTTTIDQESNMAVPTSKGDDFHASSQKIDQDNLVLDNPQTTSHSYRAPKVTTKKRAEQVESKFEAAINSISYDTMAVSSTKIAATYSTDDEHFKDSDRQYEIKTDAESEQKAVEFKLSETSNKDAESNQESNPSRSLSKSDIESRKSVLNELLDMSCASLPDGFEDKEITAKPGEELATVNATEHNIVSVQDSERSMKEKSSNNSMFLIMRDSEDQLANDNIKYFEDHRATDTQDLRSDDILEQKLDQLLQSNESRKSILKDLNETKNKSIIDVNKTNIDVDTSTLDARDVNKSRLDVAHKTFKDADDTRELLEILSKLTDKTVCNDKPPRKSVGVCKSEQTKRLTFALDVETSSSERLSEALSRHSELKEYEETPAQAPKKPVRLSQEVIKTLKFDDDDARTPLKKTAFGETSYMTDKSKVIPSFISDTDGIKELMDDLVKPMADIVVPLTTRVDKSVHKSNSTCSTQIQANLFSSSQIDFELCSTVSNYDVTDIANEGNQSISRALKGSMPASAKASMYNTEEKRKTESNKVLIFDQNNPLNNVVLAPTEFTQSHKYNPDCEVERVTVKYDKDLPNIEEEISYVQSEKSLKVTEVADSEVNTVIAMKQNKELLEDASSLTLIDDTDTEMDVDDPKVNESIKVIYQLDEIVLDEDVKRKRSYSPTKVMDSESNIEVTPKPLSKVQRISNSPVSVSLTRKSPERRKSPEISKSGSPTKYDKSPIKNRLSPTRKSLENRLSPTRKSVENRLSPTRKVIEKISPTKSENRASLARQSEDLFNKPNTIVTVQRMAAEYEREERPHSFTSSNSFIRDASILSSDSRSESRTKSCTIGDSETSTNVVAKIDMMSCMGTKLCEWDTTNSLDCMSFRLLHARVRLVCRLAHRHDNAARSHVRADTRVLQATARALHNDPNPTDVNKVIACLGVNFAADAMRHLLQGVERAGDIPDALRRCARVAERAQRWAKCMFAAHAHIALAVTLDGRISYKVVNFPLKSVWQVSMRMSIEMNANGLPCPLASEVSVASVVGAAPPAAPAWLAQGGGSWGHAVHTIWRVFKYLKNLKEDMKTSP